MNKLSFKNSFILLTTALLVVSAFFVFAENANALTTLTVVAPNGGEEWRGIQNITWTSTGGVPGDTVNIVYSTDGFLSQAIIAEDVVYDGSPYPWNTALFPESSNYQVRFVSDSNLIYDSSNAVFTVDNTAPTTTYAITPAVPDGLNGWYVSVPTITLTCSDAGSGCNNTYYKWDDAASYTLYTGSFSALEGEHTLSFYSDDQAVDASGVHNEEIVQIKTIKVDTAFPTVAVTSTSVNGSYNVPDDINVTLTFSEPVSSTDTLTVTLDTLGTCSIPVLTNTNTGTCTYTVGVGQNSSDLTVSSIVPASGVVEDIAGNDSTLVPTSNISDTSDIVIDTTSPSAFTVGTVVTTGGTIVTGWWNSTNTGVDVDIPVAVDSSLTGGTIQLQAEADGIYENVGSPYTILIGDLGTTKTLLLTATELEAIAGFSDGDEVQFKAIITDLAGNPTTGTESVDNFNVDQTLPSVNAGIDEEVNALVSQDATVTDSGSSGIASYLWTGPATITFGTSTTEDTTISAGDNGVYTITLTVTDNAGNVAPDTIQFVWDTIAPVVTEVTPVSTPTNDTTPSYVFNVDSVKQLVASVGGSITYGGACLPGDLLSAIAGENTTTYGIPTVLADATYSDCTIVVTDAAGNSSTALSVSSFEIDTIVATVSTITTLDANLNGLIDTAVIVFTDEIKDSTFSISDFTVGGTPATSLETGIANDDTITLVLGTEVAGTEAKTVMYIPGSATDLAGNIIAPFSIVSIDSAKPVLLSAKTVTTTTLEATFSEDLNGATVNSSGNEFAVSGTTVTSADETAPGVVTLTYAPALGTGATPSVTFTNIGTFTDLVGNEAVTPTTVDASDGVPPILTAVSITSDNVNPIYAMEGNTVILSFTSSEPIAIPTVMIQGALATTVTDLGGGTSWTASRVMSISDTQGTVAFSVAFEDVSPAENAGITVTATTDISSVFFDSVNPLVDAGSDKEVNAPVSQDATVSDPAPSSGGLTYAWTMTSGPGSIIFGTPAVEDTTIGAFTDGTYIIRLTVTDNAGNVTSDEITFIWDTTNPVLLTSSPSNGSTGVAITAGTATVTYDEDIVLLNGSRVLLVNDVTGASYKSSVSVSGGDGASAVLNINYSGLDYGTKYRINVKDGNPITGVGAAVRDVAGNWVVNSLPLYFTTEIDMVPPVVNSFSASDITTTGAILNVTTNENATCRYAVTDSAYASMTPFVTTGGTSHTSALTGLSSSTGYDFYVRCADISAQANEMTTSAHVSFTTLTPDTTAPEITNIQASVTDTGATITWVTDELATSRIEYGLTSGSGYGTLTPVDGTADKISHSVTLSGLTPGTTYHFRVLSDDATPNAGVSGDNTFTTTDTTAPAVPVFTTASATTDADTYTVAGTVANDGGNRTISIYNGATLAGTTVVPRGLTAWSLLVPLTQDASNVFTATASDVAGNPSAVSSPITIIELTTLGDITAPETPVITTGSATADADTYTIEGTAGADLPSDGPRTITIYNNGIVMGSIVLLSGEINWSFVASLNQDTTNTFTAYSTDESGNTAGPSSSVTITEETVADTTAPVISNIQTNSIGIATATITWTTDEPSTSQVEYGLTSAYGASTDVDSALTTSHSVIVSGLASSTVYHFRVKSTDASLNAGVSDDNTFRTSVDDSTAVLAVTNISSENAYAKDNDSFADGWKWIFYVTVPTDEIKLQMKFDDWVSGGNTILAAGNIRFYSEQSSDANSETTAVLVAEAGEWTSSMTLSDTDLDTAKAGRQIQITVQAKVPVGSALGSYSTSYGIQSLP